MKKALIIGASVSLLLSIPWLALSYAGQQGANLPNLPIDLFELFTRILPGGMVNFGLETMIGVLYALKLGQLSVLGKAAEFIMAYLMSLLLFALLGALFSWISSRARLSTIQGGALSGGVLGFLAVILAGLFGWGANRAFVTLVWLFGISLLWGFTFTSVTQRSLTLVEMPGEPERRRFLLQLVFGSLALSGVAAVIGRWLTLQPQEGQSFEVVVGTPAPTQPAPTPPPTQAGFIPVEGTRSDITPIKDFYRVDINLLPPGQEEFAQEAGSLAQRLRIQGETEIQPESYLLVVEGLVDTPLALDLNTLKSFTPVEQYATLECISNPVGGDLISTTLFRGARLKDVLAKAGLKSQATYLKFTCIDGYTESLPIESALDQHTLLCYSMGNQPLSAKHGAPLRLYTPNRFGMKNPKWIIKIEAIDSNYQGYWENRGWDEQAFVQTTSVIDVSTTTGLGLTEVGGIAFAGARGIERVELQVDDDQWTPAKLDRPLSQLTWVLWRGDLDIPTGNHRISVRAVDGSGNVQTSNSQNTLPKGATGLYSLTVNIRKEPSVPIQDIHR